MEREDHLLVYGTKIPVPLPPHAINGEQRLMLQVLEDAIKAMRGEVARRQVWVSAAAFPREAVEWACRTEEEDWPFSFTNICVSLKLDESQLRRELGLVEKNGHWTPKPSPAKSSRRRQLKVLRIVHGGRKTQG